jgi:hypothetical protein
MRHSIALAAVLALVGSLAVVTTVAGGGFWKAPPFSSIGINTVGHIDNTFDENPDPNFSLLSVWVETGSASTKCLATLNESSNAVAVDQLYCSARTVTFDGSVHNGLYLHLILAAQLPDGSYYDVNVYQEGAKFYDKPRICDMKGCN